MLLTWHNIALYQQMMKEMRDAIAEGALVDYAMQFATDQRRGDEDAPNDVGDDSAT